MKFRGIPFCTLTAYISYMQILGLAIFFVFVFFSSFFCYVPIQNTYVYWQSLENLTPTGHTGKRSRGKHSVTYLTIFKWIAEYVLEAMEMGKTFPRTTNDKEIWRTIVARRNSEDGMNEGRNQERISHIIRER